MKKLVSLLVLLAIVALCASEVFAGGDQNRGDKGQGTVTQTQVRVKK